MKNGKIYLLLISFLFSFSSILLAQGSENPFDLSHRAKENPSIIIPQEEEGNPFDIQRLSVTDTDTKSSASNYIPPFKKRQIESAKKSDGRFLFWTLTIIVIILSLIVTLYSGTINKVYRGFTNANFMKMIQREQRGIMSVPYISLYLLSFINIGLFIFLVARYYQLIEGNNFTPMLYCMGGVALLFLLKNLLLVLIGFIFPIDKEIKPYNFTIVVFSIILGLVLIPFNTFIAFASETLTKYFIYVAFGAIIITYLYRFIRGLFIASRHLSFHKFHFFMYLCTVEIAPVLILIKILLIRTIIQ